jgi:hypothetical protein
MDAAAVTRVQVVDTWYGVLAALILLRSFTGVNALADCRFLMGAGGTMRRRNFRRALP